MTRLITISGDTAFVPLTKGYTAVIDAADSARVGTHNWCALVSPRRNAVYAVRGVCVDGRQVSILLHRFLLAAPVDLQVDHRDGDGLNCRRLNMRLCTHAENQMNKGLRGDSTSGYKGVCWDALAQKWKAEICRSGTRSFLGHYDSPEDAHGAYVSAAVALHGEFARAR